MISNALRARSRWLVLLLAGVLWAGLQPAQASSPKKEEPEGAAGVYLELKPAFIANYGGPGAIHYLKIEITLRLSEGQEVRAKVSHHMPYIRHVLVMLLSRQTDDTISTMEGKEKLRAEALAAVQKLLQEEEGAALVEDLLFTNFIVQR